MFWIGLLIGIAVGVCFMLFVFRPLVREILAGVNVVAALVQSLHHKTDAVVAALKSK